MSEQIMEEWLSQEISEGFMDSNLQPIKCRCGAKSWTDKVTDRDEHGILEYDRICTECGTTMGNWAYGHWVP